LLAWCWGAVAACAAAQEPAALDYPALLHRLVDADWLWQPPLPGERCVQWSSFDRASEKGPKDPAAWYANDDRGKYLRVVERDGTKEFVMVETAGPGCVARIWSANPAGTLHFDVDGERVWSVDFAALCAGKVEGVPEPLAGTRAKGGNCHLPIPFAKSLKVSATAGDLYYHVDVVQFAARVPSFSPALLTVHRERIAATTLGIPTAVLPYRSELFGGAGPRREVAANSIVRHVRIAAPAQLPRDQQREVLRECLLVVRCGGEETVRVPVADFFAGGPEWREHGTRFLGIRGTVGHCAFPMPMPAGGSLTIEAEHDYPPTYLPTILDVATEPLTTAAPLLFRASYHVVKGTPTRPFSDHLVLDAKGRGRFVGCSLLVCNPSRIWWGEGDEKVTVDGEAFPSWFGTGTEDYFGYAWCDTALFHSPFHAQVQCDGPMNFGFTLLHRTHLLDSVPFQTSLRFEFERWHWVETTTMDYATVAYWYGAPGATAGLPPVPPVAAREIVKPAGPPMFVAENAFEGEALRVVSCSGGAHLQQDAGLFENTFSSDFVRTWHSGKVGDTLVLAVPIARAGRHRVTIAFAKNDDGGIVQCAVGGTKLGDPFDGYADRVRSSGPVALGEVDLPAGDAELRFELVGRNPLAKPVQMVSIDYVRVEVVQ